MTPEFKNQIDSYPEITEDTVKLIFIRDRAKSSYVNDTIGSSTKEMIQEIIELGTVSSMSKEDIGIHIANIEKCRQYLSAHLQGLKIGYQEEIEPKIKAKNELEKKARSIKTGKESLEDKLKKFGLSLDSFSSQVLNSPPNPPAELIKVECPECKAMVLSLKFHSCPK